MAGLNRKATDTSANHQFVVDLEIPLDANSLALVVGCTGGDGLLGSQNMTVGVSSDDGASYTTIDTVGLGTAATKFVNYNHGTSVNPAMFTKVRITVPQLGSGKTAFVYYAAK